MVSVGEMKLDNCKLPAEIDSYFELEGISETQERCDVLITHMGIVGLHLFGGEKGDPEILYSLLKESFCDGNWRLISGRK